MQHLGQEEEGVELARVPDHSLPHDRAEECGQHDLEVAPFAKSFGQRRLGRGALFLHLLENGRFMQLETQIEPNAQEQTREQVGNTPAPFLERRLTDAGIRRAHQDHDAQSHGKAKGRGDLDPAGVKPALVVGCVFGNIGGRATIFATQSQALEHAQYHQHDRCPYARRLIRRQEADAEGREAHHHQRDDEGITPAKQIADPPEHQRAKRAHDKACRKDQQRHDRACGRV